MTDRQVVATVLQPNMIYTVALKINLFTMLVSPVDDAALILQDQNLLQHFANFKLLNQS